MKRFKKILKWTGITIVALIIIFVILVFALQNKNFNAPYPALKASTDSATIERGRYLVYGPAHCSGCHSPKENLEKIANGEQLPLQGGYVFELPIGKIISPNITPDEETGIGKWGDSVIARSLRYGVGHDGRAIFDFMPFHNLSDEDLTAVISFLRSQQPIKNEVNVRQLNFLGKAVNAFMMKPVGPEGEVAKSVTPDTTAAYGEYIANYITNCRGCHTKRDLMTGAYIGEYYAGGFKLDATDGSYCVTPNLTPDKETGKMTGWSQQQFIDRFRLKRIIATSDMPWEQFKSMSDDDLKAIYNYLQTLQPIRNDTGPAYVSAGDAKKK